MTQDKEVLTVDEVATMMGCAPTTVEEHARNRVLPGVRLGHDWRFPRRALVDAINQLAVTGALQRKSPKKEPKAITVKQEKPQQSRRRPIPELPTLRSVG